LIGGIPGLHGLPESALTGSLVTVLLLVAGYLVRSSLARPEHAVIPGERAGLGLLAQYFVEAIANMAESVIGHGSRRFVPLLGTFFIFILVSNLLGLVPGFSPPTSDITVTFALGAVTFVIYHYHGMREHGAGYVKQFLGPMLALAPLILIVELFSHAFRPISLGIRLFANMFADHQVIEKFTELVPIVVPVPFYALGAFVCVVQAFVFTLLTAIYISLAISHDH
jgi:F-type H+-transporting ATPase subunit a